LRVSWEQIAFAEFAAREFLARQREAVTAQYACFPRYPDVQPGGVIRFACAGCVFAEADVLRVDWPCPEHCICPQPCPPPVRRAFKVWWLPQSFRVLH
jgi:hypothetical protein